MASGTAANKEKTGERKDPESDVRNCERNPTISVKLTKSTKEALDKARGTLSYSEFLKSLITPGGAFSQFEHQRAQLAADRAALENERKSLALEYDKQKRDLEGERKNLHLEYEQKDRAFADERNELIRQYKKKIQYLEDKVDILVTTEHFYVECSRCHNPILIHSRDSDWDTVIKPTLLRAFSHFFHDNCMR